MSKWRVVTWMGQEAYDGKLFDSYLDARDYISEKASELFNTEEEQDGYQEDMYAEKVKA